MMNLDRVLGALLQGAAKPPRRRRRRAPAGVGGRGANAQLGRALGALAGAAIEALQRGAPASPPAPPPLPRPVPDLRPAPDRPSPRPWEAAPPPRRFPDTGPATPPPEAEAPSADTAEALLLVRAMIAAAKADGRVDADERQGIAAQLDASGLSAEERDFVLADFDRPLSPEALAREAGDPMLAARVYAAAVVGAGDLTEEERAWLDRLARALRLDRAAAAAIEARLAD